MRPPCLNCKVRHIGCHDRCNKYKEYKEYFKTRDEEEQEYKAYVVRAMDRMRGKRYD